MKNYLFESLRLFSARWELKLLKFQFMSNKNPVIFVTKWKMTTFLSKSVKLTLDVFLEYSYDLANFHPNILIEAILTGHPALVKSQKAGFSGIFPELSAGKNCFSKIRLLDNSKQCHFASNCKKS